MFTTNIIKLSFMIHRWIPNSDLVNVVGEYIGNENYVWSMMLIWYENKFDFSKKFNMINEVFHTELGGLTFVHNTVMNKIIHAKYITPTPYILRLSNKISRSDRIDQIRVTLNKLSKKIGYDYEVVKKKIIF